MRRGSTDRALALRGGQAIEGFTAGSVGLAYRTEGGRELFLTSAHVVSGPDAYGFGDPVRMWVSSGWRTVGTVHRMLPVATGRANRFDVALATPAVPVEALAIGDLPRRVAGYGGVLSGSSAPFFYWSEGEEVICANPELVENLETVLLGSAAALFQGSVQLAVLEGRPAPGHSGSLLVQESEEGLLACGVVFAGSDERVLVNRLEPALRALSSAEASGDGSVEEVGIDFCGVP